MSLEADFTNPTSHQSRKQHSELLKAAKEAAKWSKVATGAAVASAFLSVMALIRSL